MKLIKSGLLLSMFMLAGCAIPSNKSSSSNEFSLVDKIQAVNVKTINTTSSVAAVELDRECKHPVESFSIVDSAATLGVLFARAKMSETFGNQNNQSTLAIIKNGAKQINWLPMEVEIMLSEKQQDAYRRKVIPKNKNQKEYVQAQKILDTLVANIGEEHDYKFQVFIINDKGKNALALPGGFVYISKNALKDENFVKYTIAHEISHSLKRHETMELQSLIIDSINSVDELSSVLKSPGKNISTIAARALTNKTFFMKFHEDQELTADACGVALIKKAYPSESKQIIDHYISTLPSKAPSVSTKKQTVFDLTFASMQKHPISSERRENLVYFRNKQI